MELKPCKACKNQVSAMAITCPNCGVPLPGVEVKKEEKKEPVLGCLMILACMMILVLSCILIKFVLNSV